MVQKTISIKTDKNNLIRGTLLEGDEGNITLAKMPAVLFIHGWGSNENRYLKRAEAIERLGYICLTFNMGGCGTSDGRLEEMAPLDNLNDSVKAYEFLALQRKVDGDNIHIVGASYGGYLASILSSRKKVKSLVLRAPALYKDQDLDTPYVQKSYDTPRTDTLNKNESIALDALSKFDGRILLIESERDQVISHVTIQNYINAIRSDKLRYELLRGADHGLSGNADKQFTELLLEWFAK